MEFLVISIKDTVTGRFLEPTYAENKGAAKRWFNHVLTHSEVLNDNPEDYELYTLGTFKDDFGMSGEPTPKLLFTGKETINGR